MGGIDLNFTIGGKKEQRRKEWDEFVQNNPDVAPTVEDYVRGRDQYVATGAPPTRLPTGGETRIPLTPLRRTLTDGVDTTVFPEERVEPETRPIQMGRPMVFFNSATGEALPMSNVPAGAKVTRFNPRVPQEAMARFVDENGNVIRTEPIKGASDRIIKVSNIPTKPKTFSDDQPMNEWATRKFYSDVLKMTPEEMADAPKTITRGEAKALKQRQEADLSGVLAGFLGDTPAAPPTPPAPPPTQNNVFASEEEAIASGLPEGSIVVVNGQSFRLER